jgi:hypothetical protein
MWVMSEVGFFSIVRKAGDDDLTIRARAEGDLAALRQTYLPSMSPLVVGAGTDYPYRVRAEVEALAEAMAAITRQIDYANFKARVHERQGAGRAHAYARVWTDLLALEAETGGTES